jgi:hypothetical protein
MNCRLTRVWPWLVLSAAAFGAVKEPEPMRGVKRGEPRPAVAVLLVGVNDIAGSIAEPGWPLIVTATRNPDDKQATTPIPPDLAVRLTDERGTSVTMTFEPAPIPAGNETTRAWLAAESATARLAPGRYHVSLAPVQGELSGWRIESGDLQFLTPNPERRGLLGHLKIQRLVLLGKVDDALAEADRMIAANASDQAAWIAKGDLLVVKDQPDEALQAYDRALSLHAKTEREPIAIQARRRAAFMRSLEMRGVITLPPRAP